MLLLLLVVVVVVVVLLLLLLSLQVSLLLQLLCMWHICCYNFASHCLHVSADVAVAAGP
jgi:hypothetical protein